MDISMDLLDITREEALTVSFICSLMMVITYLYTVSRRPDEEVHPGSLAFVFLLGAIWFITIPLILLLTLINTFRSSKDV